VEDLTVLRRSVSAMLFSLLGTTILAGQVCRGAAPFEGQPIHPFIRGQFSDETTIYGGGIGVGGRRGFGDVKVEWLGTEAFWEYGVSVGGDAGLELRLESVQVCPVAEVTWVLGPNDINGTGVRYRERDYGFGVTAGVPLNGTAHAVSIIPTGSYAHMNAHNRITGASGAFITHDRASDIVTVGVGFLFSQHVGFTPSVSWASWAGGSSRIVGLRITLVPGRSQPSIVNRHPTSCAGLASSDSTVYDTSQVTERPRLRGAPELTYPGMQRDLAIGGRVIVDVIIAADGSPELPSARIVRKVDPKLDGEALNWIGGASYWPACRDGRPVRARITQPVDFCPVGCARGKS
jgi:TonB family protein